jgi:hypothetical protein
MFFETGTEHMGKTLDLAGKRFNRLLVIKRTKVEGARNIMWECQCDCGNTTVAAAANIGKTTKSCGCLAKETAAELLRGNTKNRTHNMCSTVEHATWTKMKQRCHNPKNPKYPIYGARGIFVCERWLNSFENFFADMGPRPSPKHSIDRRNNDGPYAAENCHWATKKQQGRNTRTNHIVEIDGLKLCVTEWCEKMDVPKWKAYELIRGRGRDRMNPPAYETIDAAILALYRGYA